MMPGGRRRLGFKVDNASRGKSAKIAIRQTVADAIGGPVHVFEAFAGTGELYRAVWQRRAASYAGCDLRYFRDGRRVFVADNRRVLRAIDLAAFNVFDLDAYGSPWEQAMIITARRTLKPGERIGIVVTEGNGLNYKNGIIPHAVNELIGLRHAMTPGRALNRRRAEVQERIWQALAVRLGATLERLWRAQGVSGQSVAYMGAVLRGNPQAQAASALEAA
jgi:hypothetical protein